jgi:hypothetical protein
MPFSEALKLRVKRRAHFSCCLCHALGVEVHHVIPEAEGGPDTENNAAPLCPSCHETYGANPQKRKFIRESREFWFEVCEKRFASDADRLKRIENLVERTASIDDLTEGIERILDLQRLIDSKISLISDRELYAQQIDEMRQRIREIERELQVKAYTLEQLQKRNAVAQLGAEIAIEMARNRANHRLDEATAAFSNAAYFLIGNGEPNLEACLATLQAGFAGSSIPKDPTLMLLYHLTVQLRCAVQLSTAMHISSSVVSTLLEEYDRDPNRTTSDLVRALSARIRAGELDSGAAKPAALLALQSVAQNHAARSAPEGKNGRES